MHYGIYCLLCVMCMDVVFAADNDRIKNELRDTIHKPPLRYALGKKKYKEIVVSDAYYYVGNNKCRLCHREFFLGRKKDQHDFTMKRLIKTDYQNSAHCLPCHTTGYGVPTGFISLKKTPKLKNVQCEGCHGPGNLHINIARKTEKGGGLLAGPDKPKILKKMCKSCHTDRWNRSYTKENFHNTFTKYKNSDPNK